MFIREYATVNKNTGARYVNHRLVESIQTDKGPRQRIIMPLGRLTLPKSEWRKLAAALESRLVGQISLFEEQPEIAQAAEAAMERYRFTQTRKQERSVPTEAKDLVTVDPQSVTTMESRSLGPELVAHTTWQNLGVDAVLKSCGFNPIQRALAEAVVVNRLVSPSNSNDLATWRWLKERTALVELLAADLTQVGKDAVYEIADRLLAHKDTLEKALRKREGLLFGGDTIFLYDLTNTYFEGQCLNNDLAKRGKSKEHRSDCPLVALALVVDSRGFPIMSQIYSGNQPESETLEGILDQIDQDGNGLFNQTPPTIVMDRGVATQKNVQLLKNRKYPYIVVERRATEKEYLVEFEQARDTFERLERPDGWVYVKKIVTDEDCRVLCLSEGREYKEVAMDALQEERFIRDLTRLQNSVSKRNILLVDKVSERVGRLKERYPSMVRHYDVRLDLDDQQKKVVRLTWEKKPSRTQRSTLTGCYVIQTSHKGLEAKEIWRLYTTLTKVEAAFRALKTDLGVRPVHHQLADRTRAHLFISVLAYHLLICIEEQLRAKGDRRRWSTIRTELFTHQRTTITMTDSENRIHHIRVSGRPEKNHQEIYQLLNVTKFTKQRYRQLGKRL